jgi:NAD(P)-dependent dehydrogenase (short-subunit alcohol dehydrogenase family)
MVQREILARAGVDPGLVGQVIGGCVASDASTSAGVALLADAAHGAFPQADVLVNNAHSPDDVGVDALEITDEAWEATFAANTLGRYRLSRPRQAHGNRPGGPTSTSSPDRVPPELRIHGLRCDQSGIVDADPLGIAR